MKEKLSKKVTGVRLTPTQERYLEDNKLNLRDVLDYYMNNHNDRGNRLKAKKKYLLNHIDELETDLKNSKIELKEVMKELGEDLDPSQQTLEIMAIEKAGDLILQRAKSKYEHKLNKTTLEDYIQGKEANRVLTPIISEFKIKDIVKFKSKIFNHIKKQL